MREKRHAARRAARTAVTSRFVVLTGLSGSGKSQAIRALEDLAGHQMVQYSPGFRSSSMVFHSSSGPDGPSYIAARSFALKRIHGSNSSTSRR